MKFLCAREHLRPWRQALLAALLVLSLLQPAAHSQQPPVLSDRTEAVATDGQDLSLPPAAVSCFEQVWQQAEDHPWYLDAKGQRVIPTPERTWLVIFFQPRPTASQSLEPSGFLAEPAQDSSDFPAAMPEELDAATPTADALPADAAALESPGEDPASEWTTVDPSAQTAAELMNDFHSRFSDVFDYYLLDPDGRQRLAAYRLRAGAASADLTALLERLARDPAVLWVQPAWKIGQQRFAPLDRMNITWKTTADAKVRQRLLEQSGAVDFAPGPVPARETVHIDACRMAIWQAAVLLAEDLHVLQAVPQLLPLVPPLSALFTLDLGGATLGTPLPFRIEIRFLEGIRIESSTIANLNLRPPGIFQTLLELSYDHPLSAVDLNRSPVVLTGKITLYAPGEFRLPDVPIYYTDTRNGGQALHTHTLAGPAVRIAALLPDDPDALGLKVVSPGAPPPFKDRAVRRRLLRGAALAISGMALMGLAAWGWRQKAVNGPAPAPDSLAANHRLQTLQTWLQAETQALATDDFAAMGTACRELLAEVAHLPATRRGGGAGLFLQAVGQALPADCRSHAEAVLQGIEQLLAAGAVTPAATSRIQEHLRQLLEGLRPLMEKQAEGGRPKAEN
jgi:hypothetical protein